MVPCVSMPLPFAHAHMHSSACVEVRGQLGVVVSQGLLPVGPRTYFKYWLQPDDVGISHLWVSLHCIFRWTNGQTIPTEDWLFPPSLLGPHSVWLKCLKGKLENHDYRREQRGKSSTRGTCPVNRALSVILFLFELPYPWRRGDNFYATVGAIV